jgi:spore maturation protein CgeB
MTLLLVGETGAGALLQSLAPGLRLGGEVVVMDTAGPGRGGRAGLAARVRRRRDLGSAGARVVEAVHQLKPDVVLLVKGRGLDADAIAAAQRAGAAVACYYPDNPWWSRQQEPRVFDRLRACDLAITFSVRQAARLQEGGTRAAVLPFGYDPRWYPLADPAAAREDVVFLGTWSRRRQRYLAALTSLPVRLVVRGTGWERQREVPAGPPVYEQRAGALLARARVGVNLLHPQGAGGHNMRTREITASGALQLTDPGTDGSPLRDGESCRWFTDPDDLRRQVLEAIGDPAGAVEVAAAGQAVTREDTYVQRGVELRLLLEGHL